MSPSTVQRLTESWRAEHAEWAARGLSDVDYVYVWADGVHVNVRLPDADGAQDRLCVLVIVGVRPDGRKELVTVVDGQREDTGSWLEVLRDLRDRGMRAPALAVAWWIFPRHPDFAVKAARARPLRPHLAGRAAELRGVRRLRRRDGLHASAPAHPLALGRNAPHRLLAAGALRAPAS